MIYLLLDTIQNSVSWCFNLENEICGYNFCHRTGSTCKRSRQQHNFLLFLKHTDFLRKKSSILFPQTRGRADSSKQLWRDARLSRGDTAHGVSVSEGSTFFYQIFFLDFFCGHPFIFRGNTAQEVLVSECLHFLFEHFFDNM